MKKIIAENILKAAKAEGWSSMELGKRSHTNQTTMNRLMRARDEDPAPRITSVEAAVKALKVEPWAVMIDGATLNMLKNKKLTKLILDLSQTDDATLDRIIENASDTLKLHKIKD